MTENEKREYLRQRFEEAKAQKNSGAFDKLNTPDFSFSKAYLQKKPWQIGPFVRDDTMTFNQKNPWVDPWDIDWRGGFLFNPSLIKKDNDIYMFYRLAPKKECLCSRIGLAVYKDGEGWWEFPQNPLIYPELDNELLSTEDPKVYAYEGGYIMFYNRVHRLEGGKTEFMGDVGCDIGYAVSSDLLHWEKRGLAVPVSVSRHWAKGAVIPRDENGRAVRVNGQYMMFLSEGCGGSQHIGYSKDMINWEFKKQCYLEIPKLGKINEVACAVCSKDNLIIDFFYSDKNGDFKAAQALYSLQNPLKPIDIATGGTLAWGGLIKHNEKWIFAQGWDAEDFDMDLFIYRQE